MKPYSLAVPTALLSALFVNACEVSEELPRDERGKAESPVAAGDGDAATFEGECNGCAILNSLEDPSACPGAVDALQAILDCQCEVCPDCAFCAPTEVPPTAAEWEACQACSGSEETLSICSQVADACASDKRVKAESSSE